MSKSDNFAFQVKPRIFKLLGDQLIRDANVAVFELVKNAYDADATYCKITLEQPEDSENSHIVVEDNGCGMNEQILRDAWMVIATDYREDQRAKNTRTPKFGRFPLGEKGLGRFSIHKLGRFVRLITRQKNSDEFVLEFDWDKLEQLNNLQEAIIVIEQRAPQTFSGDKHGTRIEASKLRESWTRGRVRSLHRAVNSLCSPYGGPNNFRAELKIPQHKEWLDNLMTAEEVYKSALYYIHGHFENTTTHFTYKFVTPVGLEKQISSRAQEFTGELTRNGNKDNSIIDLSLHKIGKVEFEFHVFDRDPAIMRSVTNDIKGLKEYLNQNGGIRIYRDGIRVYDFGEPGNDWLNLDSRRVNTPTARTSNNQILGVLRLDATISDDLREKSNREGFIENNAFEDFRNAVISVLTNIEAEKIKDQKRIREVLGKGTGQKLFVRLGELREVLSSKGVLNEVESRLKEVEREMEIYQNQLLHAAVPGLTIGSMLHGAEKILDELRSAVKSNADMGRIKKLIDRLYHAMRPITNLLKNPEVIKTSASDLIKEAVFSVEFRLKAHDITLINDIENTPDFPIKGSKQMLIASITNLIDNAIHWLDIKKPPEKYLYIGTTTDIEDGAAIVIADNGPGFGSDDPEDLITPFFTRRTGSMGLGLYIVNEVMRANNGSLIFPDNNDVTLPQNINGAVVALQFPEDS